MKKLFTLILCCSLAFGAQAQSRSVERFRSDHRPSLKLFFYKSTLKMYSRMQMGLQKEFGEDMADLPQLSEMINGIEKIKFFNYEESSDISRQMIDQLVEDVHQEGYEDLITARIEGNLMNVMMKESRGEPEGFVVIVRTEDGFNIIDIEGYPDVSKILELSQFINGSSDNLRLSEAFR
ncbi:DUF4252 domain-containing protein [Roseivirga sp.]|uniref:DUF4252 domain-containing protein n=1 Tax=Roseivirga sp. TaxID=1964215 RepID=UPI003B51DB9C